MDTLAQRKGKLEFRVTRTRVLTLLGKEMTSCLICCAI